jgi:hypothetical protein
VAEDTMSPPSRADDSSSRDFANAIREASSRVSGRGVFLHGNETHAEIVELDEALEAFERAVESAGGDLMVDEPPPGARGEPDDPRFLLPQRVATMSVAAYLARLAQAIDAMRKNR